MTTEELRELDAWIAVNLFGWEWLERWHKSFDGRELRKAIFGPEPEWIRWNFNPAQWKPAKPETRLFSDWERCCSDRDEDRKLERAGKRRYGLPHYSTDPAAAMEVLKRVTYDKCAVRISRSGMGGWSVMDMTSLGKIPTAQAETLELAICQFAKKLFTCS